MTDSRFEAFWRNLLYLPLVGGLALFLGTSVQNKTQRGGSAAESGSALAGDTSPDEKASRSDPFIPTHQEVFSFPARPFDDPFRDRMRVISSELPSSSSESISGREILRRLHPTHKAWKPESGPELLVMAALVRGSDFKEDKKERIEKRHAIEMALAASGFQMSYTDRLSYYVVKNLVVKRDRHSTKGDNCPSMIIDKAVIPTKVYESADGRKAVVLWIDERMTEYMPLGVIRQIIEDLFGPCGGEQPIQDRAALAILGPTYSESLQKMIDTADQERASASFWQWKYGAAVFNSSCTSQLEWGAKTPGVLLSNQNSPRLRLVHAIGTDEELISALCRELQRRGVLESPVFWPRRVVIFVEQDLDSTKQLAEFFRAEAPEIVPEVVPFLRGISDWRAKGAEQDRTPELVSDYLVRTLENLSRGNSSLGSRLSDVNLVGVFSSSVHDKIAIIESARELFPNATMFTVDMASEFEDAQRHPRMRNTIVASHYGLSIEGELFDSRPNFRSSYQTSAYVAAAIALQSFLHSKESVNSQQVRLDGPRSQDLLSLWNRDSLPPGGSPSAHASLEPIVAEIGNYGAFVFSAENSTGAKRSVEHPRSDQGLRASTPILLCLIALFLLIAVILYRGREYSHDIKRFWIYIDAVLRNKARQTPTPTSETPDAAENKLPAGSLRIAIVVTTGLIALTLVIMGVEHHRPLGEPFSLTTGISLWPSVILFLGISVAIVFWMIRGNAIRAEHPEDRGRAVWLALLMLTATFVVALATGSIGDPPGRSWVARWLAWVFESLACTLLFFVACHVSLQCLRLRQKISEDRSNLPKTEPDPSKCLLSAPLAAKEMNDVLALAQRSEAISRYLLFPSALAAIYAVARLPVWDAWLLNVVSYSTLLAPLVIAVLSYFTVRYAAWNLRGQFVRAIDVNLLRLSGSSRNGDPTAIPTLENAKKMLKELDVGAFAPLSSDPFLGSLILLGTTFATGPFQGVWSKLLGLVGMGG